MRASLFVLTLPLLAAACGGSQPPPQIVVASPPPVSQTALAAQCQSLFAQSLNGQATEFSYPLVTNSGDVTSVSLQARTAGGSSVRYSCIFNGSTLASSNPG
jgi:hypothetical protein